MAPETPIYAAGPPWSWPSRGPDLESGPLDRRRDRLRVGGQGGAVEEHARRAAHPTLDRPSAHVGAPVEVATLADATRETSVQPQRRAELGENVVAEAGAALLGLVREQGGLVLDEAVAVRRTSGRGR